MGKGRSPCCDKTKVKRGSWTRAEDLRLISFIQKHGHPNWRALPKQAGLLRCGKSCRLRWINYLRPDIKRGNFCPEEEQLIISLHQSLGNKWSKIASQLPGRTDNEIKNFWNTHLKKRAGPPESSSKDDLSSGVSSPCTSSVSNGTLLETLEEESLLFRPPPEPERSPTGDQQRVGKQASALETSASSAHEVNVESLDNSVNTEAVFELPLDDEANIDWWDIMEYGRSGKPTPVGEVENHQNSAQVHGYEDKESNKKEGQRQGQGESWWLEYLENELGLSEAGATTEIENNAANDHPPVLPTCLNQAEEMFLSSSSDQSEFDPVVTYFHIWPNSPLNCN